MKVINTDFVGLYIIEPTVYEDQRGFFYESYSKNHFKEAGIDLEFVQDNESHSVILLC